MLDSDVAVIGAGVVGSAVALAIARRGAVTALLEAEHEPGLGASGTNSGVLHTAFDSVPGEVETELILGSVKLRDSVLGALGVPLLRCGAVLRPRGEGEHRAVAALAANAKRNGAVANLRVDGSLEVPGEAVTDPIAYTGALATAARGSGAEVLTGFRVAAIRRGGDGLELATAGGQGLRCRVAVNCAGLHADEVAALAGDRSFEIYPRKGEFLVFEPPGGAPPARILLPVPTKGTKGVLVFPTIDGKVAAGPTAVDQLDKEDWSVRPEAPGEILPRATALLPELEGAEPIAAYAGLRPAGRGVNYLIGPSRHCPGLINVAAIRSTGLTASLAIGERVAEIAAGMGVAVGPEAPLTPAEPPRSESPWWRRVAELRGTA